MKHIRNLLILTLLASMSSCSVFRPTTTQRTARSFEIETDIKQMPTVADLVVDSVYVREDTAWTNITFKYTVSKAAMRKELIGLMLEENEADVIVQPREKSTTTVHHPFKQSYTMEIYGYPARYRNFRTATEEDLRILNGIDPQPVNYNTIYIGGGYTGQPVGGTFTQAIREQVPMSQQKTKKPPFVRNKYIGTVEFGYNWFPLGMMYGGHGFLLNTNHLFKTKNPNIYHGAGIGLNTVFGKYDDDNDAREWHIPIYYTPRFYFGQRKVIPFFDLRIGGFMSVLEWNHNNDWKNQKEVDIAGGLYYAAFLGLEFGKHVDIAFGTDQFFGGASADAGKVNASLFFTLNVVAKMAVCF